MSEDEKQSEAPSDEQQPDQLSPSEKLEDVRPSGSLTPGAENPESKEIKKEINPNTE